MSEKPQRQQMPKSGATDAPSAIIKTSKTGEDVALKLQQIRGCVIVGYPPNRLNYSHSIGMVLAAFAGSALEAHTLLIIGEATRKDWDEQAVAIYGAKLPKRANHPVQQGEKFFRCTLQESVKTRRKPAPKPATGSKESSR